ncbi:GTP-binding protein 2 [Nannizzia gypsea CBS 118893]|uniref:GTP-binding protein 2 n=1 Tax=Arthroderma gypseum (strain ATCC MYA-4604 / CBS 118893) TaxID=535722 RepID=E4UPF5_ARTGP|nr:GTP-binding protein 2 [Nannizzia gypsea CBS 118893]EFQ99044.1 GTP-binding protein 2 [Nannizzia gypsea CBS 118893]
MASVFTFDPDLPRVSSPWSSSGATTPRHQKGGGQNSSCGPSPVDTSDPGFLEACGIKKLEPEPQDGPTEYKLHLLLRPRRPFVSLTSGAQVSGSHHSKPHDNCAAEKEVSESPEPGSRTAQSSSNSPRQARLCQLTTQLLWRLQQSSPFHSSSTANLVLPALPEATESLNVPSTLSPLLPGLEESQGALYEIGVTDDGTFAGLAEDELDESLVNLQAMAASLGCRVEVLRRVAVGYCKWVEKGGLSARTEKLWVAEALVSPDLKQCRSQVLTGDSSERWSENGDRLTMKQQPGLTEQLNVAIAGASGSGKSSLLGILSTSALDNGRGKSRLSLLRHRHEIASGVTSSIAHELIGYSANDNKELSTCSDVINYASGNINSWDDIHVSAGSGGRVIFLSDLPGSLRYVKSALRGLMSLRPHYVLLCVPANNPEDPGFTVTSEVGMSLAYLELCVKLEIPVVVVVTKLDSATRSSIRQTLTQVLSAIKAAGRKPVMLPVPGEVNEQDLDLCNISPGDRKDANAAISSMGGDCLDDIPIIITSSVTGAGVGKLHALLQSLRVPAAEKASHPIAKSKDDTDEQPKSLFDISEVFEMPLFKVYSLSSEGKRQNDRGIVLYGRVRHGAISIGDRLVVGPIAPESRNHEATHTPPRAKATYSKSLPDSLPSTRFRKFTGDSLDVQSQTHAVWKQVRVVSVRNLKLPVKALFENQIGTIGVDFVDSSTSTSLGRMRKGMVLADFNRGYSSNSLLSSQRLSTPVPFFHSGFIARFHASDFITSPPVLVSGGTSMIYVESIRAAARVILVEQAQTHMAASGGGMEPEMFMLDAADHGHTERGHGDDEVNVTFSLTTSAEWLEVGSLVLAVPGTGIGVIATPPPSSSCLPSMARPGLPSAPGINGVVGRICEVLHA